MKLPAETEQKLITWVRDGQSVSQVQKALEELGHRLTYMEVRFLLDDLSIDLPEPPAPEAPEETSSEENVKPEDVLDGPGEVSVEVDKITRPGVAMSGSVKFSDGVKATWGLDPSGRLMIDAGQPGYQPPAEDISEFQTKLRQAIEGV